MTTDRNPNLLDDKELARMAQRGDRAAFEVLCDRYLPSIYNRLRAMLPQEAVEDVTQEVFLAAMRGIKRYRRQSSFRTWITAIARHKAVDYYRKQSRQPSVVPLEGAQNTSADSRAWEEHSMVRIALKQLPVHYQEVLLLRFAEGMPFNQIAEVLGISLEATKSRCRRAIAAMAKEMGTNPESAND